MLIDNEAITLTFGNVSLAWPILIPLLRRAALPPFAPFPRVKSPSVPFLYAPIFLPGMILPPLFCQQSNTVGPNLWILETRFDLTRGNAIADNIQNPEI